MAKTEKELRDDFERFSERENWSAWLIVAALIMEAYAAWYFSTPDRPWYETTFLIAANLAIAAGVYGEIRFGRKADAVGAALQQISDQKVADANARAEEANRKAQEAALELARLKTPRTISPELKAVLVEMIKPFAGTPFDLSLTPDPEPMALMNQVAEALTEAGWNWLPVTQIIVFGRPGKPNVGMHTGEGIQVLIASAKKAQWESAVLALANALALIGLERVAAHEAEDGSADEQAIHIRIGVKPQNNLIPLSTAG